MSKIIEEYKFKNYLCELVDKYLIEESCVAEEVKTICKDIEIDVYSIIKNGEIVPINYDRITHKIGTIYKTLLNNTITISVHYFNFFYKESYNKYIDNIHRNYKSKQNGNTIQLVIESICGNLIIKELSRVIFHEVEHLFQRLKRNKDFDYNIELYNKSVNNFNSNDTATMIGSRIIYYFHKFEQDAFINDLYGELMKSQSYDDMWKVFKKSETYDKLQTIIQYKNYLNKLYNEGLKDDNAFKINNMFFKKVGVTLKGLLTYANKTQKRLENKMGKVWIMAQNDYKKEHKILEEPIKSNNSINIIENLDKEINRLLGYKVL